MKAEVFKALVNNNGCRTFVIEGDFGGGLKVDAYIHGGEGTAQEAVAELGFGIYRTKELAELADWMRSYNAVSYTHLDVYKRQISSVTIEPPTPWATISLA